MGRALKTAPDYAMVNVHLTMDTQVSKLPQDFCYAIMSW